jgi:hypothetical protein
MPRKNFNTCSLESVAPIMGPHERANARLKDDFGGRFVRVRGHSKVMSHLMFGLLALMAEQLMRLFT